MARACNFSSSRQSQALKSAHMTTQLSKSVSSNELQVRDPISNNVTNNKEKKQSLPPHTNRCVQSHKSMLTSTHAYPTHIHIQLFICIYAYIHMCMHICLCVCVCIKSVWVHYAKCTILNIRQRDSGYKRYRNYLCNFSAILKETSL